MAREMKNSGVAWIGAVPSSWSINSLSQLFVQVKNKNSNLQETNLLSLSYGKIKRRSIESSTGLLPESFDGYNIIEKDDIVLRLTDLQNDQTSLRVGLAEERGIITSAYLTIRKQAEMSAQYLFYYLYSFDISKGFYGMGGGVRQGLNWDGVKWLKVLVPPFDEQKRIAIYLSKKCAEIDAVLEKTRTAIGEYKKLKQAIITQAVTKGVRGDRPMKESGIEWIGNIPSDYSVYRLKHLVKGHLEYGANASGVEFSSNLPRYIRITDITIDGKLKEFGKLSLEEDTAAPYILRDGDILFARSGATVGKSFIYKETYGRAAFAGYLIRATIKKGFSADYIYLYMNSSLYDSWKNGIFVQSTIQNIGADRYAELPIVMPNSFNEQLEIVDYLNNTSMKMDKIISKKERILAEIESYKRSLIYEYVTGKKEAL